MKRAIITGATGAIGTALTKELVNNGVEVLIITRKDSKRNERILRHPLVSVKYAALDELAALENDTGVQYDVFYHLAWAGAAGPGRHDMYMQNANVKFALDAVGAAKRFGCRTFIGAGSQAEYGRVGVHAGHNVDAACFEKLRPDTPAFPEMGYGYAKLCAGQMTRDLAHQLGLEHIWVRILSIYGPGDGAQSMVMSTIDKLKSGIVPEFTKGEQLWDYLYSGDAAEAFRLIGEKGRDGSIYVLGSGNARPLREYIETIRDIAAPGAELKLGAVPYSEKQVMYLCADVSELERDTGWKAHTDFADGIRSILG